MKVTKVLSFKNKKWRPWMSICKPNEINISKNDNDSDNI